MERFLNTGGDDLDIQGQKVKVWLFLSAESVILGRDGGDWPLALDEQNRLPLVWEIGNSVKK